MQLTVIDKTGRLGRADARPFFSLELETRSTLPTSEAAAHLNRRPQTLRCWAMNDGSGPIRPLRINGRLAWNVAEIKQLLGVAK